MKTASIAALAFVFAESFYSLFSVNFQTFGLDAVIVIKTLASLLVIGLSYINHRGLIIAEKLSNLLTFLMLLALS